MNLSALAGILAFALGVTYSIQAYMLPLATVGSPTAPKVFPLILGIAMTLLGLNMTIQEIKKGGLRQEKASKDENVKAIIYTSLICLLYAIIYNKLGYVISTFIFLELILALFNGKEKWKVNTIVSLAFSIVVYLIFTKLFGVMLPYMPYFYI